MIKQKHNPYRSILHVILLQKNWSPWQQYPAQPFTRNGDVCTRAASAAALHSAHYHHRPRLSPLPLSMCPNHCISWLHPLLLPTSLDLQLAIASSLPLFKPTSQVSRSYKDSHTTSGQRKPFTYTINSISVRN
jgi:hypothetical protein